MTYNISYSSLYSGGKEIFTDIELSRTLKKMQSFWDFKVLKLEYITGRGVFKTVYSHHCSCLEHMFNRLRKIGFQTFAVNFGIHHVIQLAFIKLEASSKK